SPFPSQLCQVDWCTNLTEAKQYYRRDKLCEVQAKASAATVADAKKRFCQQCSRFHELSEFDEPKRSSSGDSFGEGSGRRGFNGKHETSYDQLIIQATTDKINIYKHTRCSFFCHLTSISTFSCYPNNWHLTMSRKVTSGTESYTNI
ncbi:hypothetical protein IGI04_011918, partial [Brassica rapa subsp. trilocularis]